MKITLLFALLLALAIPARAQTAKPNPEARKSYLRHAVVTRVLSDSEMKEVLADGPDLFDNDIPPDTGYETYTCGPAQSMQQCYEDHEGVTAEKRDYDEALRRQAEIRDLFVWTSDAGLIEMNTIDTTTNTLDTLVAGPVTVNLKDGSVTFSKGMTSDQAARAFWEAVSKYAGLTECHQKP